MNFSNRRRRGYSRWPHFDRRGPDHYYDPAYPDRSLPRWEDRSSAPGEGYREHGQEERGHHFREEPSRWPEDIHFREQQNIERTYFREDFPIGPGWYDGPSYEDQREDERFPLDEHPFYEDHRSYPYNREREMYSRSHLRR